MSRSSINIQAMLAIMRLTFRPHHRRPNRLCEKTILIYEGTIYELKFGADVEWSLLLEVSVRSSKKLLRQEPFPTDGLPVDSAGQKPLHMTTDKHPAYMKAIRWIISRKVLHRHNQYLNNRMKQDHRHIKQRYYPLLGFAKFESASRFCTAFDELRNYLRVRAVRLENVPADVRRKIFTNRWLSLMTELSS